MRILHVTHELPPYELAGTAIYSLNIARAQAEHHDVFIFARLQDTKVEDYRLHTENRDGCTIRFMNRPDISWSPFADSYIDPKAERIFRDFVEEVQPEIIHFQHIVGLGMGTVNAVKAMGITCLFTLHDFWAMCPMGQRMCYTDNVICDPIDFGKCGPCVFNDGWKDVGPKEIEALTPDGEPAKEKVPEQPSLQGYFKRRYSETPGRFARKPRAMVKALQWRMKDAFKSRPNGNDGAPQEVFTTNPFEHRFNQLRAMMDGVDLLITPSAFLRDEFIKHFGRTPQQIIHSANGMDFGYVKSLPKPPSDTLRFGFMGSIIPTKGVEVLVDAFIDVAKDHSNISLDVFGAPNRWTGAYMEGLQKKGAESNAADRITFHGRYDNKKVGETLSKIDVLVVPSIWFENAPLTLNEAAMTRTPIVVSDRGGMLEFATANDYGRTFELGNAQSLAKVVRELAEDPSKVTALAGNTPPIKSVSANAEELVEIYRQLRAKTYVAPSIEEQTENRGGCITTS